jgi:hypothetical protein
MSCEVEEVERSISVFYGNADLDFVRGINLNQRGSRREREMAEEAMEELKKQKAKSIAKPH